MSILVLLWAGTLGIIYASSYFEMKKQNLKMLETHAEMYALQQSFDESTPTNKPKSNDNHGPIPGFDPESPMFRLSTFYTVALSYDGDILEINNDLPTIYSDDELQKLAQIIIKGDKQYGTEDNLAFYKTDKGEYTLVTFMDNTVINESAITLLRYTLIFGAAALVLFFFYRYFLQEKL